MNSLVYVIAFLIILLFLMIIIKFWGNQSCNHHEDNENQHHWSHPCQHHECCLRRQISIGANLVILVVFLLICFARSFHYMCNSETVDGIKRDFSSFLVIAALTTIAVFITVTSFYNERYHNTKTS